MGPSHAPVQTLEYRFDNKLHSTSKVDPEVVNDSNRTSTFAICFAILQQRTFTLMAQTLAYYNRVMPGARTYAYLASRTSDARRAYGLDAATTQIVWKQVLPSGYRQDRQVDYAIIGSKVNIWLNLRGEREIARHRRTF